MLLVQTLSRSGRRQLLEVLLWVIYDLETRKQKCGLSPCNREISPISFAIPSEDSGTQWNVVIGNIQAEHQLLTKHDFDKHAKYFFQSITLESWISHQNHSPRSKRGLCVRKQALSSPKPCERLGWKHISREPYAETKIIFDRAWTRVGHQFPDGRLS